MQPHIPEVLPIQNLDFSKLAVSITQAERWVARFNAQMETIPNRDMLLAPLSRQEAVLSNRIEGSTAGTGDVMLYEANIKTASGLQHECLEISNYRNAVLLGGELMKSRPFSLNLLLHLHEMMLAGVGNANTYRGRFRQTQNWIGRPGCKMQDAAFVPPQPFGLMDHLTAWERYWHEPDDLPMIQIAVLHAQFEILHPFSDGNGRVGRMIIPLFLHEKAVISSPHLFASAVLEANKDIYIDRLRGITSNGDWTGWVDFFLLAMAKQAEQGCAFVENVRALASDVKARARAATRSPFVSDFIEKCFERPYFTPNGFVGQEGMPSQSRIYELISKLADAGIVSRVLDGKGEPMSLWEIPELTVLASEIDRESLSLDPQKIEQAKDRTSGRGR